jgi:hypothetical protein
MRVPAFAAGNVFGIRQKASPQRKNGILLRITSSGDQPLLSIPE